MKHLKQNQPERMRNAHLDMINCTSVRSFPHVDMVEQPIVQKVVIVMGRDLILDESGPLDVDNASPLKFCQRTEGGILSLSSLNILGQPRHGKV